MVKRLTLSQGKKLKTMVDPNCVIRKNASTGKKTRVSRRSIGLRASVETLKRAPDIELIAPDKSFRFLVDAINGTASRIVMSSRVLNIRLTNLQLEYYLPDEYEVLSATMEALPMDSKGPCPPFAGFVLNINACSNGHRDAGDLTLCVVVPFGDFVDGDLIFYELGIALQLKSGHMVVFRSNVLTHFNLHYVGVRGSLVFHSDKELLRWVKDCNGFSALQSKK